MCRKKRNWTLAKGLGALFSIALLGLAQPAKAADAGTTSERPVNPLDSQRAFGYLEAMCALGPRPSGSTGMEKQQAMLKEFFEKAGGKVTFQRFRAANPLGGDAVPMANIIVEWHPERKERILLCAHYDTRPLPDRDPDPNLRQNGIFLGANDGASGVAVLMELAHLVPKLEGPLGIDVVMLDGEELVYVEGRDPYCLGADWFAQKYAQEPPAHKYRWGVLLDMVGDANLQLYQEHFSATWQNTRPLVKAIWATAQRLGVREFIQRGKFLVSADDHIPLRNTGKIPTCDIIDFVDASGNPPPSTWHTTKDDPQHCAPSSLAKVGWVVYEWMKEEQAAAKDRAARPQASNAATSVKAASP
jgi:hypothetical protein